MTRTVALFFLGGTISMAGTDGAGVVSRLGADDLLAAVPGLDALDVVIRPQDVQRVPSASLTLPQLGELAVAARAAVASGADGVVVVQGTDTIEETSFLLDLLLAGGPRDDAPVVVTGAMRNPALAGADGPANLLGAIAVAASDAARGLGALVVLDDEIHAARYVAKRHTSSPAAFVSPGVGKLGSLTEGRVSVNVRPAPLPHLPVPTEPARLDVRVPLWTATLGDDGSLLPRADGLDGRGGLDGLVVAGLGGGHVPERLADRVGELARRVPVVLASRAGAGRVLERTYGAPGAEIDLIGRGLVSAGGLDAYKARILLAVLVAGGAGTDDVRAAFAAVG